MLNASIANAISLSESPVEKQICNLYSSEENNSPDYDRDALLTMRTMADIIKQLDEQTMWNYLVNITSFGPRVTGTQGCENVANYLYDEFEGFGLKVKYHNWSDNALSGKNVEATLEGSDKSSDKIYIICGHYDGVPETIGADDNGAGTVSVLCAAKILSQYEFDHTIRFVLFSGEEQGIHGSYYYALDAAKNKDNIVAVLNIDMTGYATNIEDGNSVLLFENIRSQWISEKSVEVNAKYHNHINLEVKIKRMLADCSDHFCFWQNGYDAIFYYEAKMNPDYHTPQDNLDTVNITYATKIARLSLATIAELSQITNPIIGKTLFVGGSGPNNFSTITEAIENSSTGDTIKVNNGTYNEQVIIDKSIDLIGEDSETTHVVNDENKPVVSLLDNFIVLSGFSIKNNDNQWCSPGIDIESDYNVIIENNVFDNKGYGIGLNNATFNGLFYNKIHNNTDGIMLWRGAAYNQIHNNEILNNEVCGIGISANSDYTCLKWNIIKNNQFGIYTQIGLSDGIGYPEFINAYNNIISHNDYGIYLGLRSSNNKFILNNITDNKVGLFIASASNNNMIWKNNFINNELHATFDTSFFNIWIRNYWDNRTVNIGPKIIKGSIKNIPWKPLINWINLDLLPSKKPHNIKL